jgi:hypothetical protein
LVDVEIESGYEYPNAESVSEADEGDEIGDRQVNELLVVVEE